MSKKLVKFDMLFLVMATFLLMLFIADNTLKIYEAGFFVLTLIIYTYLTFKMSPTSSQHDTVEDLSLEAEEQIATNPNMFVSIIMLLAGVGALASGAHFLVLGASEVARIYDLSEATIAVTIVAIGGSAPEIVTSVISAIRKHSDLAIGNVVGSNIFNILGVLGIGGLIQPFKVSTTLVLFDIWVVFIATLLLFMISVFKKSLSRLKGALFLVFYALYIIWQIVV